NPIGREGEVATAGQSDRSLEDLNRDTNEPTIMKDYSQDDPALQERGIVCPNTSSPTPIQPESVQILGTTGHTPANSWQNAPVNITPDREPARMTPAGRKKKPNFKKTKAHINIFTLNMNGGGSNATDHKWLHINQLVRDRNLSIGVLQETHLTQEKQINLERRFPRLRIINSQDPDRTNAMGVAICINRTTMRAKEATSVDLIPGRAILTSIPWTQMGRPLNILGIYAPNTKKEQVNFWEKLVHELSKLQEQMKPDIMLGDFNIVENKIDRFPPHPDQKGPVEALQTMRDKYGLIDQWRNENPTTREFTYKQALEEKPSQSRIDRIYLTQDLAKHSYEWKMEHPGIESDHKLTSAKIEIPNSPYIGKGRWAFPVFLLQDREMMQTIKNLGNKALNEIENQSPDAVTPRKIQTIHKEFKDKVREEAQKLAKRKVPKVRALIKENRERIKLLLRLSEQVIAEAPENQQENPLDNTHSSNLTEILTDIGILEEKQRLLHLQIHNKTREEVAAKHILENETMSKTWINQNKNRKPRDTMYKLQIPNTSPTRYATKSQDMANVAADYHDKIQRDGTENDPHPESRSEEIKECLSNLKTCVSEDKKGELAKQIQEEEIERSIRNLPNGKSPGLDGLPREFYMQLLEEQYNDTKREGLERQEKLQAYPETAPFNILKYLQYVFCDIQTTAQNPESTFSDGWMCPLYKKNDKTNIANYRPITVLNTDYKIMTKLLTNRLTNVVGDLIHKDQAGFMKGRRIEHHTDLVHLLTHLCEVREEEGAIICLDQEKAYDKIRHDFLWASLRKFNIPNEFINTVQNLYHNAYTSVIINGVLSKKFRVTRGVRQGDPLSCLLFNLAIESLAENLRCAPLEGITMNNHDKIIASLFADDTTVYLSRNDDIQILFDVLTTWCRASGAKFNVQKTEVIPLGNKKQRAKIKENRQLPGCESKFDESLNIAEDGVATRILGAWVGHDIDNEAIWNKTVEEINDTLQRWERSHPTQEGRRLIINMYVAGKTQYLTRVQGMPEKTETRIERIVKNFMWGSDKTNFSPPVKTSILQKDKESGGRKVLDIRTRNEAIELKKLQSYIITENDNAPIGKPILDEIIQRSEPGPEGTRDPEARTNIFQQTWQYGKRGKNKVPPLIHKMLKTSRKVNMELNAPIISKRAKEQRPIWYHPGLRKNARLPTEGKTARDCLRKNHKIRTVGDMLQLAQITTPAEHLENNECECRMCMNLEQSVNCVTPHKCRSTAISWIDALNSKWNPLDENDEDIESPPTIVVIDNEAVRAPINKRSAQVPPTVFNPDVVLRNLEDGYRIFIPTKPQNLENNAHPVQTTNKETPAKRYETHSTEENIEDQTSQANTDSENMELNKSIKVEIVCKLKHEGQMNTEGIITIWHSDSNDKNTQIRVETPYLTEEHCELIAITLASREHKTGPLIICTKTNKIALTLNQKVRNMEDLNFPHTAHPHILQNTLAELRKRNGVTTLKAEPCTNAKKLAQNTNTTPTTIDLRKDLQGEGDFKVEGAKLKGMTQSQLYQGLLNFKEDENRKIKKKKRRPGKKTMQASDPSNQDRDTTRATEENTLGEGPTDSQTDNEEEKDGSENPINGPGNEQEDNKADLDDLGDITRKATRTRLNAAREAIRATNNYYPNDRSIWNSIQNKNISLKIRQFLWLAMHDGQRIGNFWNLIGVNTERATCTKCDNKIEDMNHILTECKTSGQDIIWELATKVLQKKGILLRKPHLGDILACGWNSKNKKSKEETGKERLHANGR
ncbi:hypothetical protein CVT24_000305, partial [Panaeolus cyanescens]